jgi:hypothetical protein
MSDTRSDYLQDPERYPLPSKQVISRAAWEIKSNRKLSKDLYEDIALTRSAILKCDQTSKILKGYVQTADMAKKQFVFHSELQLIAFHKANAPGVHIDATGGVIYGGKTNSGGPFYYYSISFQDKSRMKTIILLSSMLSQQHSTFDVATFLTQVRKDYQKVNKCKLEPKYICIDASYAMLNGILESFNLGSTTEYLDRMFTQPESVKIKIKQCKAHEAHSWARKVSKSSYPKEIRRVLNKIFSDMIESSNLNDITNHYKKMIYLLTERETNDNFIDIITDVEGIDIDDIQDGGEESEKVTHRRQTTLRKSTKAGIYFDKLAQEVKRNTTCDDSSIPITNPFHNMVLAEHLLCNITKRTAMVAITFYKGNIDAL